MVARKRDSQRSKVYAWGWALYPYSIPVMKKGILTLSECADLAGEALASYNAIGLSMPLIRPGKGARLARGGEHELILPIWARQEETVLHEVAHSIMGRIGREKDAAHGPEFARICVELWSRYTSLTKHEILAVAKDSKVKIARGDNGLLPCINKRDARGIVQQDYAIQKYSTGVRCEKAYLV